MKIWKLRLGWWILGTYSVNLKKLDSITSVCQAISLVELTIQQIHDNFAWLNSQQLIECYLNRISKLNPHLQAILEINKDAIRLAKELDFFREYGEISIKSDPLLGIPVLIDDTIEIKGSDISLGTLMNLTSKDAKVVTILKKTGAIIIGRGSISVSNNKLSLGWSTLQKQARNAYFPKLSSQSGAIVGVAANLAITAVISEASIDSTTVCVESSVICLKMSAKYKLSKRILNLTNDKRGIILVTRTIEDMSIFYQEIAKKHHNPENKLLRIGLYVPEKLNYNIKKALNSFKITHLTNISLNWLQSSDNDWSTKTINFKFMNRFKWCLPKFLDYYQNHYPQSSSYTLFKLLQKTGPESPKLIKAKVNKQTKLHIKSYFHKNNIGLIVISHAQSSEWSQAASQAGYPVLTIPIAEGLALITKRGEEGLLIQTANKLLNHPYFIPSRYPPFHSTAYH